MAASLRSRTVDFRPGPVLY